MNSEVRKMKPKMFESGVGTRGGSGSRCVICTTMDYTHFAGEDDRPLVEQQDKLCRPTKFQSI